MKMRLLPTLAALAIGLAVEAFALWGNLAGDAKALDEFMALGMKVSEAYNNNDAAALAALFTEEPIYVSPEGVFGGPLGGRQAIEKAFVDVFQRHPTNFTMDADPLYAIGNDAYAAGQWWCTLESQNGAVFARGYWSAVYLREGDAWKIRMLTFFNKTPLPAPPAKTK
jgi:uncharacterized protein (TIGR02246 family)